MPFIKTSTTSDASKTGDASKGDYSRRKDGNTLSDAPISLLDDATVAINQRTAPATLSSTFAGTSVSALTINGGTVSFTINHP